MPNYEFSLHHQFMEIMKELENHQLKHKFELEHKFEQKNHGYVTVDENIFSLDEAVWNFILENSETKDADEEEVNELEKEYFDLGII